MLPNLPTEIVEHICYFADTNTIKNLSVNLKSPFWQEYFSSREVKVTNQQDNLISWIYEFHVNSIIAILTKPEEPTKQCQYILRRGLYKGQQCQKLCSKQYCDTHMRILNIKGKFVLITYDNKKLEIYRYQVDKEHTYNTLFNIYKDNQLVNYQLIEE